MRDPQSTHRRSDPTPPGRRIAQLPPDPPRSDPPPDPPPGDVPAPPPSDAPPEPPPGDPPTPPPSAAPTQSPDDAPTSPPVSPPPISLPPAPPAKPPGQPADGTDDGKTEVITLTGSTIEHKLFTGRAPVTIVTRADLTASGRATLGDILQSLPIQSNAGNAQVNAGGDGTTRINLRGLGAPRTLVLLNGRRVVNGGSGADAAVDINAIPLPMIERVEILKDGASALYGADAIGGVVNLITRPQFDGIEISLLTSTSQRGDGTEYDASFVTGLTTSDRRTYLVVSGGYQRHYPVFASDRAFSAFQRSYDFTARTETRHTSLATPGGRLDVASLGPGGVQPPGCASNVCKPDGNGGWADFIEPRDEYNDAAGNYLYTPSLHYNVFATAGNRVNDHVALFLEALYQRRDSDRRLSPVAFVADDPISKDSLYNPLGGDILDYRRRMSELGPQQYIDRVSTSRFVAGITGDVPGSWGPLENWKYEVSANLGSTEAIAGTTGQLRRSRVADALGPSMLDTAGNPICVRVPGDRSTQIIYAIPRCTIGGCGVVLIPCIPLNLLAPAGTIPPEQLTHLGFDELGVHDLGSGTDTMYTVLATASGRIAALPNHGEISMSLGADYRHEVGGLVPPTLSITGDTTDNEARATDGEFRVTEGFGELAIVPISGQGLARWVELDLGARALRDNRFGSSRTYKAGGLFRTVQGIAVRGTYATAFRAPTVADLFRGRTERNSVAEDPCDTGPPSVGGGAKVLDPRVEAQCAAQGVPAGSRFNTNQQLSVVGGNPDLRAETAATTTIGVVFEPPQVKGLALTADYWHFDIHHAIETLGVQTIFANCYDRAVQSYCDQIHRDPITHRISSVDQVLQNVTRTTTSVIDLAVWHDTRFAGFSRIHTGLEAQYLLSYDLDTSLQVIHGVGFYDLGVYPRYKANLSSSWVHPSGASGGFTLRFVGTYKECAGNDCNSAHSLATASRDVDRYVKLDLFGAYDFRPRFGRTTLQLGINNVFDATPPVVYNAPAANSDAATYDFIGRMIYVRLSQLF
ncbi:MAG: TonB-dependent receptor [Deltaproteobacteria bacterium]|nr:MAG: TonB-dependent receptor [Deltaproteobacteria bacterium]